MKSGGILKPQTKSATAGISVPALLELAAALAVGLLIPFPTLAATGINKMVADVCHKTTDAAYRAKYCSAAKDLKKGYNANKATAAVWTGVSVACGYACGKKNAGMACTIANYGGIGGEGLITKKFTDSLTGEATKAGEKLVAGKPDGGDTSGSGSKLNGDACVTSGTSALKAFGKNADSKQNEKGLSDMRDQTKEMNTPVANSAVAFTGDTQNSGDSDGTSAAATAGYDPCGDAAIGTALGAIRCAASNDPSLPPYVKSEEFVKDLQKATGKSPDAFFANFENPAKSISESPMAAELSPEGQRGLADSMEAMEGYSASKARAAAGAGSGESSSSGYAAAARTPSAAGEDTGFDMNGMIASVLGQGQDAEDGANAAAVSQLTVNRRPAGNAAAAEDPKISIFDRVQWRYGAVSARDRLGVQ